MDRYFSGTAGRHCALAKRAIPHPAHLSRRSQISGRSLGQPCCLNSCKNLQNLMSRTQPSNRMESCCQHRQKEFTLMMYQLRNFLTVFLICLTSAPGLSQQPQSSQARPRLGLVLEGGGALGLAHIGVIQYLEQHHIPVNYIAGTSMGGLVGGLYATGLNADDVRKVVKDIKWDEVISGQTPFHYLSFRRRQDAREYPSTLEFGLHQGLQFPSGFNSGQQVDLILDRIALPYSEIKSFDELPIPFACVATDLVTRSAHVFRSGPLNLALRATMSRPGIFSPVRDEGHIYVDGGLLNNFPVDVAREMGAGIVLGIHLEAAPVNPEASL